MAVDGTIKLCECGCGHATNIAAWNDNGRGIKRGEAFRFLKGHFRWPRTSSYYKQVGRNGLLHRIRAERALGKPLPPGAIVHHADGSRDDNAPLVICPHDAYHLQLHARLRVRAAGGHPWTDKICGKCKAVKPKSAFRTAPADPDGLRGWCRDCDRAYDRARNGTPRRQHRKH